MYSEAESLASSILKRLCKYDDKSFVEVGEEDVGFRDMLESTGMVLVQSLKALGRYLSLNSYVCFEREAWISLNLCYFLRLAITMFWKFL